MREEEERMTVEKVKAPEARQTVDLERGEMKTVVTERKAAGQEMKEAGRSVAEMLLSETVRMSREWAEQHLAEMKEAYLHEERE